MKSFIILFSLFIGFNSFSQSSFGFFGKKNFIDFSANLHTNTFLKTFNGFSSSLTNSNGIYYAANGTVFERKELRPIQSEFLLSIGRQIRPRFAMLLHLKYGIHNIYSSAYTPSYIASVHTSATSGTYTGIIRVESKKFSELQIIPMFSFNPSGISAPSGINIQFGVGPTIYKLQDPANFLIEEYSHYDSSVGQNVAGKTLNIASEIKDQSKIGVSLALKFGTRKNISKNLAINYGVALQYNFLRRELFNYYQSNPFGVDGTEFSQAVFSDIATDTRRRFASAFIGLSYIF